MAQNDSPSMGADLLRDWLGPAAPGRSIFSLHFLSSIFSNVGHALLSKSFVHYIDQGYVLHVHAFCTTHVCATFLCTAWVAFLFIVFPLTYRFSSVQVCTALLACVPCIRHSPVP